MVPVRHASIGKPWIRGNAGAKDGPDGLAHPSKFRGLEKHDERRGHSRARRVLEVPRKC